MNFEFADEMGDDSISASSLKVAPSDGREK